MGRVNPWPRPPGDSYETADSRPSQESHGAIGHSGVTNGSPEDPPEVAFHSYETPDSGTSQESHGAIGHSGVTNGSPEDPPEVAFHSYETPDSGTSQENHGAIGHSRVTDGSPENPSEESSRSYETPDSGTSQETHGAIGHSEVPNGSSEDPPDEASHSYETPDSGTSQETHGAIGHSEVPNGSDEGQEYLPRRARVRELVMNHRGYYTRSFTRGGLPSAVEYFSRSAGHEQELMDQVALLEAGGDPRQTGAAPPPEPEAQSQASGGLQPVRGRAVPGLRQAVRNPRRGGILHRLYGT